MMNSTKCLVKKNGHKNREVLEKQMQLSVFLYSYANRPILKKENEQNEKKTGINKTQTSMRRKKSAHFYPGAG